jgi:hypothetical protein
MNEHILAALVRRGEAEALTIDGRFAELWQVRCHAVQFRTAFSQKEIGVNCRQQDYGRGIILFRGVVVETICRMILQLLALKMLAVHAALIGVLGFIPVREHHVVSDLLLLKVSVRATAGTLAVSARPDLLLPSL